MYNPRIEFIPIVKQVERDDSFKAQKIGSYQYVICNKIVMKVFYIPIPACGLISEGVVAIFGPSSAQTSSKQSKLNFIVHLLQLYGILQRLSVLSAMSSVYHTF